MNVQFFYMYRDGGNCKNYGSVIFSQAPEDLEQATQELQKLFDDEEHFIAGQIGLPEIFLWDADADYDLDDESTFPPDLGPGKYCVCDDMDHCWHEFQELEFTEEPATDPRTWAQFMKDLRAVKEWAVFEPMSRKGQKKAVVA